MICLLGCIFDNLKNFKTLITKKESLILIEVRKIKKLKNE